MWVTILPTHLALYAVNHSKLDYTDYVTVAQRQHSLWCDFVNDLHRVRKSCTIRDSYCLSICCAIVLELITETYCGSVCLDKFRKRYNWSPNHSKVSPTQSHMVTTMIKTRSRQICTSLLHLLTINNCQHVNQFGLFHLPSRLINKPFNIIMSNGLVF